MITISIKHFCNIIFMSYHSFIFIMNNKYFILTQTGMY